MSARQSNADDGAGCLILIALALMCIGGVFIWGPQALFVVGAAMLVWLVLL